MFLVVPLFFFNDTATTEIYTLSLHDALPISLDRRRGRLHGRLTGRAGGGHPPRMTGLSPHPAAPRPDRKSTRLNSSHANSSYAAFCLEKKKNPSAFL